MVKNYDATKKSKDNIIKIYMNSCKYLRWEEHEYQ